METIKIVKTSKMDGTETILSLKEAVKELRIIYIDDDWVKQELLKGIIFQTRDFYFEQLEDKNANN